LNQRTDRTTQKNWRRELPRSGKTGRHNLRESAKSADKKTFAPPRETPAICGNLPQSAKKPAA
jgi:hypothetical protein